MTSSYGYYIILLTVISNTENIQAAGSATGNVPVPSCGANRAKKIDCGFSKEQECLDNDCCWDPDYLPACFKKEMRVWNTCSAKCRHPGKPGMRSEITKGWTMPCNAFLCQLNTACTCQRIDVIFVIDATRSVREINFWARKQLVIDVIAAYKQIGHDTRFAVVTYDSASRVMINFNDDFSLDNFVEMSVKIWMMAYSPGGKGKNLASALLKAADILEEQGRPDVQHICMVVTDGKVTKAGQIPAAVHTLRESGTIIHAVNTGKLKGGEQDDMDKDLMLSLTQSELHVFTIDDYNTLSSLINALVTEWCCEGGLKNTMNARFDDDGEIYVNGEYKAHVTFKETGVFTIREDQNNLLAFRIKNTLNPEGRFFEVWNTAHKGITLLSLPFQWKCTHKEYPGWYGLEFDDSDWNQAVVSPRVKDYRFVGARGQKRLWTGEGDWTAFCRGWAVALCNVTYMPGVSCTSTGAIMGYGVCENTYDGKVEGRGGEWITNGATQPTITIDFNREATIRELGILNRCSLNGQAKDLSIEFSDGSVHGMTLACNAYSPKATHCDGINWSHMTFDPPIKSDWLKMTIVTACDGVGKRKGLREIQVLGDPPCY